MDSYLKPLNYDMQKNEENDEKNWKWRGKIEDKYHSNIAEMHVWGLTNLSWCQISNLFYNTTQPLALEI